MSKIKILPENLANQIAAGEVIERPASVVKEFVENAVDAGARQVTVQVEGGGSRLIRVIDDGEGMDQDDMLLSLERHATSKLQSVEQLAAIRTLGFRGEAIPSIASVSRLTITSRTVGAQLGHRAEIRFGQLRKVHEMGCSQGTVMEVRDLFGNVPARKKFLKSTRTELSHIEEIIVNCALAHPRLGLTYSVDNRRVWFFAPEVETLAGRVKEIMARQLKGELLVLDLEQEGLVAFGFLLPPDAGGPANARLRIFVNKRAVRDRMISHAVTEGLHGFLMKGRRPAGALFLELDPQTVDVNVHPTKQEIRFHRSQHIHQQVVNVVSQAMVRYQKSLQFAVFGQPDHSEDRVASDGNSVEKRAEQPWHSIVPGSIPEVREPASSFRTGNEFPVTTDKVAPAPPSPAPREKAGEAVSVNRSEKVRPLFVLPAKREKKRLSYRGQFLNSYLLCETEEGIAVIDQHAAHERLLFERLRKQYQQMEVPGQALLFPEIIDCTAEQVEILQRHAGEIGRLGLTIDEFGGESYVIKAVPAILSHLGPLEIVSAFFDHYLKNESKGKNPAKRLDDILAVMACKAAVKAHDRLLPEEGEALLRKMEEADIFSHCPHGRPVLKIFSESDIKKWFHR